MEIELGTDWGRVAPSVERLPSPSLPLPAAEGGESSRSSRRRRRRGEEEEGLKPWHV